jgi:hypothetical protein
MFQVANYLCNVIIKRKLNTYTEKSVYFLDTLV